MRLTDWQLRFSDATREAHDKRFKWGEHDCCLWVANCVLAITGIDYAESWRGKYSDESGAYALIKKGESLTKMVTSVLKTEAINPNYANVGDVVLIVTGGKEALAICNGASVLIPSRTRMVSLPMSSAKKVWKI